VGNPGERSSGKGEDKRTILKRAGGERKHGEGKAPRSLSVGEAGVDVKETGARRG